MQLGFNMRNRNAMYALYLVKISLASNNYFLVFSLGEENWGGKNSATPSRQQRRSKNSMLNKTIQRAKKIPLLQNGHRKYYSKSHSIFTYNTCSFDAIFQIFATVFIDYESMKTRFEKTEKSEFCSMITLAFNNEQTELRMMNDIYERRDNIFKIIHAAKVITTDSGLIAIDSNSNITYTIEHVLPFFSYAKTKYCSTCPNSIDSHRVFVDINLQTFANENVSIQDLNSHIKNELLLEKRKSKCTNIDCSGVFQINMKFNEIIMIDLQIDGQMKNNNKVKNKLFSINDAPQVLELFGTNFKILALAEFIKKSESINDVGHYIAHIRRFNNQWETYDDTSNRIISPNCNRQVEIHTLFYIQNTVK